MATRREEEEKKEEVGRREEEDGPQRRDGESQVHHGNTRGEARAEERVDSTNTRVPLSLPPEGVLGKTRPGLRDLADVKCSKGPQVDIVCGCQAFFVHAKSRHHLKIESAIL